MNLNNQNALYKHGMTPVFRLSGNPLWTRLKQKVTFQVQQDILHLPTDYSSGRAAASDSEQRRLFSCTRYHRYLLYTA